MSEICVLFKALSSSYFLIIFINRIKRWKILLYLDDFELCKEIAKTERGKSLQEF